MAFLSWVRVVGTLVSNGISSVPLYFKVDGVLVAFVNGSGDGVHSIDPSHESNGNAS